MASTTPELTAIILTYNEAENIVDCIDSLIWCDRVLVFDSLSDDGTVELARSRGAEVILHRFDDYAQQRNAALESTSADWVLFVDADERGTRELGQEVRQVTTEGTEAAWYVPRHNYIFGRLTLGAGWYPDYQLRLFRHGRVRFERPVHEVAVVDGDIGHLNAPLIHHNYRDAGQFHAKQRRYVGYDAAQMIRQGIRPKVYTPLTQPLRHFWWRFVTLRGYRDGLQGLRLSLYMAYYEGLKIRKLNELWREHNSNDRGVAAL